VGWTLLIVGGVILLIVIFGIVSYNRFVQQRQLIKDAWANIDTELRRRYDLIPNLIETVKGYAAHEREIFEHVTEARTRAMGATGVEDQANAENAVTAGLGRLIAVAEAYPDLKANQNFLALQEELIGTESKIAYARQFYNDQVALLNTLVQKFPANVIAGLGHFEPKPFFEIDEPVRGPVQVDI